MDDMLALKFVRFADADVCGYLRMRMMMRMCVDVSMCVDADVYGCLCM